MNLWDRNFNVNLVDLIVLTCIEWAVIGMVAYTVFIYLSGDCYAK
jgi:hypothetical protein